MKKVCLISCVVVLSVLLVGGLYSAKSIEQREVPYQMKLQKLKFEGRAEQPTGERESRDSSSSKQATWIIQTVDSGGDVGMYSSLALDEDDNVHIAYYDWSNSALKYATNKSGAWQTFIVDSTNIVGEFSSIALDSNGKVHIAYYYCGSYGATWCLIGDLKYATNKSGAWQTYTIDDGGGGSEEGRGNVGLFSTIAVDSQDKVHIAYHDESELPSLTKSLLYATNSSGTWQLFTLDSTLYCGHGNSIAIDSNDKVHISHIDALDDSGLRYTTNVSGIWQSFMVGPIGGDSDDDFSSIALDSNGKVHIAYWDWNSSDLMYATNASGSWQVSSIAGGGFLEEAGEYPSIVVDQNDNVHISYFDPTLLGGDLKYITNSGGAWEISDVDTEGDTGYFTSIAVDSEGFVHISYYNNSSEDLKYARSVEPQDDDDDTDDDIDDDIDDDTEDDDVVPDDDTADDDIADDDTGPGEEDVQTGSVGGCGC